ncbi:Nucleoporin nup49/NSP49 (Nuclear pore protein nup49/NSP49) [Paraconiothyrium brasiliense]|uniref:Nucleoporin nup49/NSP49 (Nuclear pore protein nup49/NSP49) n=1 Tax=Paraconiothyrium brasiliense TaxID=300254 RepID=A0ABR3R015_9PLEO
MAGFGRSNSLSINTGSSLFGNATGQGQQSAGLFGSSTAASQPQQTGGIFGSTSQQPQTSGLFGGASQAQGSQPPQSAGLFGSLNKPQQTTGTTGGLFGASTQQSQPQQGSGLFGGALGGNTNTQTQTSQSGGLFGGLGQNQNQAKPSLFGASTAQQNTGSSLFGNAQQQNQTSTPSLFGNTQQNQPQTQQAGGMFGGMASQSNPLGGLGQSSTLGGSQVIQMNDLSQIKGTTRLNDLHPDIQKQVFGLDDAIQAKIDTINQMREAYPGHIQNLETVAPDVEYVEKKLAIVALGLENDAANISHLKTIVDADANDAELSFRAIVNQALPAQFRYGNPSNLSASTTKPTTTSSLESDDTTKPVDLIGYFNRRTDDLGKTLETYQSQIREIEMHLRTMEAGAYEKQQQLMGARNKSLDDRQQLVEALRAIESAIVDSAKKVGKVRDEVTKHTLGGVGAAFR